MLSGFPIVIEDGSAGGAVLREIFSAWQALPGGNSDALAERAPLPGAFYADMPELEEVPHQDEPAPALPYHGGAETVPDPPPGLDAPPAWHSRWVRVMTAEKE